MSLIAGETVPVTLRNVVLTEEKRYKSILFEETLGPDDVSFANFPRGWKGDRQWPPLKRQNFARLLSSKGKVIEIEVDHTLTLARIADDTHEYFINNDEEDDEWGMFVNTTSTTSTKTTERKKETPHPLDDKRMWDRIPPIASKVPKTTTFKLTSNAHDEQPITISFVLQKGTSEYKKTLLLSEIGAAVTIEFLSRLSDMYPEDGPVFQAMLNEFARSV